MVLGFCLQYLDRIGQVFFGLPPPKQESGGIFGEFSLWLQYSKVDYKAAAQTERWWLKPK